LLEAALAAHRTAEAWRAETGLWTPHSTAFTGTPSDTRTRIDELLTLKKSACDAELKLGCTNNAADTLTLKRI
jgi:hypothetical protein